MPTTPRRVVLAAALALVAFASPVDGRPEPVGELTTPAVVDVTRGLARLVDVDPAHGDPTAGVDLAVWHAQTVDLPAHHAEIRRQERLQADRERRAAEARDRASRGRTGGNGGTWAALAACESGGNPRAVSSTGKYRGAFQFSLATWRSVGMTGDPIDHSYADQLAAAQRLQARDGWGQWPRCAARLGLI